MRNSVWILFLWSVLWSANVYAELADPTQPTVGSADGDYVEGDKMQLNAILHAGKEPIAIINGRLLKLNDKIAGYTLTQIGKESVTLISKNKEKLQLSLQSLDFKKPHQG